jgi:hypothetical protein
MCFLRVRRRAKMWRIFYEMWTPFQEESSERRQMAIGTMAMSMNKQDDIKARVL